MEKENKILQEQQEETVELTTELMWKAFERENKTEGKQKMKKLLKVLETAKQKENEVYKAAESYTKNNQLVAKYMPNVYEILINEFLRNEIELDKEFNDFNYDSLFNQLAFIDLPQILEENKIYKISKNPEFQDFVVARDLNKRYIQHMTSYYKEDVTYFNGELDSKDNIRRR